LKKEKKKCYGRKGKQQPYYKTQCQAINEKAGGQTTVKRSNAGRELGVRMTFWPNGLRNQGDTHQKPHHKCTAIGLLARKYSVFYNYFLARKY